MVKYTEAQKIARAIERENIKKEKIAMKEAAKLEKALAKEMAKEAKK